MKQFFAGLFSFLKVPGIGDPAPEFELADHEGRLRSSREFRGKWLVLYFFPRADTPG
jgi:peroxiredoxin Q/BCP